MTDEVKTDAVSDSQTGQQQSSEIDGRLEQARQEAIAERKKRQEIAAAAKQAETKLAEMEAKLNSVLDAAGLKGSDDTQAAAKQLEAERKRAERAESAFKKAAFTQAALESGIRPDRVEQAYRLADLSAVVVDLDGETADGIKDAAQAVLETMPELAVQKNSDRPKASTPAPGSNRGGYSIDLKNVKPGDLTRLFNENPDEFDKLLAEGLKIPTGRHVRNANGEIEPEYFMTRSGGNDAMRTIDAARERWQRMNKKPGA